MHTFVAPDDAEYSVRYPAISPDVGPKEQSIQHAIVGSKKIIHPKTGEPQTVEENIDVGHVDVGNNPYRL